MQHSKHDKRKKSRDLTEEERKKVIAKHGKDYKTVFKELHVLVTMNVNVIKKHKISGTIDKPPWIWPQDKS